MSVNPNEAMSKSITAWVDVSIGMTISVSISLIVSPNDRVTDYIVLLM